MALLPQLVDVRPGERLSLAKAFAALLLLIMAHTVLETARDAIVLTRLPPGGLGIVYVAVALCVLPAVKLASVAAVRFGARRALGGGLVAAAGLLIALFAVPMSRTSAVAIYVASSLIGAVLVPVVLEPARRGVQRLAGASPARRGWLRRSPGGGIGSAAAAGLLIGMVGVY